MKPEEKQEIKKEINRVGFDYTFQWLSEFKLIADDEFHKLRKEYLEAKKRLAKYIGLEK